MSHARYVCSCATACSLVLACYFPVLIFVFFHVAGCPAPSCAHRVWQRQGETCHVYSGNQPHGFCAAGATGDVCARQPVPLSGFVFFLQCLGDLVSLCNHPSAPAPKTSLSCGDADCIDGNQCIPTNSAPVSQVALKQHRTFYSRLLFRRTCVSSMRTRLLAQRTFVYSVALTSFSDPKSVMPRARVRYLWVKCAAYLVRPRSVYTRHLRSRSRMRFWILHRWRLLPGAKLSDVSTVQQRSGHNSGRVRAIVHDCRYQCLSCHIAV